MPQRAKTQYSKKMQLSSRFRDRYLTAAGLVLATLIVYLLIRFLTPADQGSVGTRVRPSLQFTVVVTRHGNRSPPLALPGFPYQPNDTTYYPYGILEITHILVKDFTCQRLCEAVFISINEFTTSAVGQHMNQIMDELEPYTGAYTWDFQDFVDIWDSISCSEEEGYPVPEWAKKYYPEPMNSIYSKLLKAVVAGSEDQIRLNQGLLFQEFIEDMRSKVNGSNPDLKMRYNSGHDFTILGIEAILGLLKPNLMIVKKGSMLILELHQDFSSGRYYIEVLYVDGESPGMEPVILNIPGCEAPCDWYRLANITEKYYNITDFQNECLDLTNIK